MGVKCRRLLEVPRDLRCLLSFLDTLFHWAISLEIQVRVALWWLATGTGYHTLAHLFGLSSSSVCIIVHDCQVVREELCCEYIQLLHRKELYSIIEGFRTIDWS